MRRTAIALAAAALLGGCGGGGAKGDKTPPAAAAKLTVTAAATGDQLPVDWSCDGTGTIPTLDWTRGPAQTKSYALVIDDPDAPGDGPFVHWTAWDLASNHVGGAPPQSGVEGQNSAGKTGWTPACPPKGDDPHHYRMTVYALDTASLRLDSGAAAKDVEAAIAKHALASGQVVLRFGH